MQLLWVSLPDYWAGWRRVEGGQEGQEENIRIVEMQCVATDSAAVCDEARNQQLISIDSLI